MAWPLEQKGELEDAEKELRSEGNHHNVFFWGMFSFGCEGVFARAASHFEELIPQELGIVTALAVEYSSKNPVSM